jgi:hypothetical protein
VVQTLLAVAFMVVIAIFSLKASMQRFGPANTEDPEQVISTLPVFNTQSV